MSTGIKGYLSLFICAVFLLTSGCGSIFHKNTGVVGQASRKEDKALVKIEAVNKNVSELNIARLDTIGELSYGMALALFKTNGVPAAIDLNKRIELLANQPSLEAIKGMEALVDELITNNTTLLVKKDRQISALETENKTLQVNKNKAIENYIKIADKAASQSDAYKATLNQMDSFLGLGAVFYGLKKFIISSMWILGIGTVLFFILKLASTSSPFASSIFSIFEKMGSWAINLVTSLVPKAAAEAKLISAKIFDSYKNTLVKVVDAIQTAKTDAEKTGKSVDISAVLTELEKTMNTDEKVIIDKLKQSLNWK